MKYSITLYDALASISMPADKAKAVVDAWENDVKDLASKSDLIQTEKHLKACISELGTELRASIREQGAELRSSIKQQGVELRSLITEQGAELRSSIKEQGVQLRTSISVLEARSRIVQWQFGIIFICISVPAIKLGYEFLSKAFVG